MPRWRALPPWCAPPRPATGLPVATQEAAHTVAGAFVKAGIIALVLVSPALAGPALHSRGRLHAGPGRSVGFSHAGLLCSDRPALEFCQHHRISLLFGVGVAFHIYFVMAWRSGVGDLLQTSLARAVVCSALATGSAFGALWFSHHPGTASMGLILMISLIWTLVCALVFEPALLGPQKGGIGEQAPPRLDP
jgi:hypothetical protein